MPKAKQVAGTNAIEPNLVNCSRLFNENDTANRNKF